MVKEEGNQCAGMGEFSSIGRNQCAMMTSFRAFPSGTRSPGGFTSLEGRELILLMRNDVLFVRVARHPYFTITTLIIIREVNHHSSPTKRFGTLSPNPTEEPTCRHMDLSCHAWHRYRILGKSLNCLLSNGLFA
ncbi:hypothetical protein CEXT_416541 [Caerostris extrusa]|uniref:Uncharacterized protein n=1 Tax=Caerostris extrusa TaxID=172846 RepID=A0AAV4Y0F2_CAEEX|nr:hypothetical protein CEXT_416541 [Caerostris extrusa]